MHYRSRERHAFTLIELSAVIVIIGILIAGIITATGLLKKTKISAAQSLTKSSPIAGITDNALWLESSLELSFKDSETSTGNVVTAWYDQKNSVNKSLVTAEGTGPIYSNTINYIHAVKFLGSTTNYLKVEDASFLNDTDYTIVVLEKRQSATAGYFIGDSSASTANQTLLLGYSADAYISHSQGVGNAYASTVSTYSSSSDTPRVFIFISDSVNGKKTYINGILAAQSADTSKLSNITTLAIGKGYTGEIGEIAIFTRALKTEERKATEDYLGKKYSTKVNRATTSSGSCLNGIVTTDGCKMDCSTSSIVGLSSPATVADGASNVIGTCAATGYAGTVTLSCGAGTGQISASSSCGCNTAAGYSSSGGVCISNCNYTVTGGSPSTGTVSAGPVSITCNTANHYSSTPFTATCSSGAAITGTCACATGYTGAGCSTCDTANNYVSSGGSCVLGCTIPAGSGITATAVPVGSNITTPCSGSFSGNYTYSCNSSGELSVVTACSPPPCTGGDTTTYQISGEKIHLFTATSTTFRCPSAKTIRYLIVGGGGSTGSDLSGGGGGGGVLSGNISVSANTDYTIQVGQKKAFSNNWNTSNGNNSSAFGFTALGGGAGFSGTLSCSASITVAGASGGGKRGGNTICLYTASQGKAGGNSSSSARSGGGGGAGGAGQNYVSATDTAGAGGIGLSDNITGTSVYYGGGGGGGGIGTSPGGLGGLGGGGKGGTNIITGAPTIGSDGTDGLGGGSGGTGASYYSGSAKGGSGVVIVRYTN